MRKQLLLATLLLSVISTNCQTDINSVIFDKQRAATLIIGKWKVLNMSMKCDAITGFNEMMNSTVVKSSMKIQANQMSFEFMPDKKLIIGTMLEADTAKYEISDSGVDFITMNEENKTVRKNYKIISITEDTLIYSREVKTSDENLLGILNLLNAEDDTNKTVIYTFTSYKIKEAKAPWAFVKNDLPQNKKADNLVVNSSNIFTIVRGDFDSVFVSNDYGTHWKASAKGLPELSGDWTSPTCMAASDKKIFIGSQSGVFSSENNGLSFTKINDINLEDSIQHTILIAATNTNIIALVDSKLYISKDDGVTWNLRKKGDSQGSFFFSQLYANGTNIIIGSMGGFLLFSPDNGESWSDIIESLGAKYPGIVANGFTIGASIFINTQYGMFMSKDKGNTWRPFANGLPPGSAFNSIIASGTNIFYGCDAGVFLSVNNGESWLEVNNEELRKGVTSLAIIDSNIFAITPENKIWKASISELVNSVEKSKN